MFHIDFELVVLNLIDMIIVLHYKYIYMDNMMNQLNHNKHPNNNNNNNKKVIRINFN